MSANGKVSSDIYIRLGGQERRLRLTIGDLEQIENKLDLGIGEIIEAFASGKWRLRFLREILETALVSTGWAGTSEDVRNMIMVEGPAQHQITVVKLFNEALGGGNEGNGETPGEKPPTDSPSEDTSKSDAA